MDNTFNIHSIESFATLEGEGIRFALFLLGCPYRCLYCHNPDTWYGGGKGKTITTDAIISEMSRYVGFYRNGGGLTATGGEPLLQADKLVELFRRVKLDLGLTNTIDTSCAVMPSCIDELLEYTDLMIIDLKFHNNEDYHKYANGSLDNTINMLEKTRDKNVRVWVRTVVVTDLNDTIEDMDKYIEIVKKYPHIEKYELLAYHTMGVYKYHELGLKYRLEGVEPLPMQRFKMLQSYVKEKLNK